MCEHELNSLVENEQQDELNSGVLVERPNEHIGEKEEEQMTLRATTSHTSKMLQMGRKKQKTNAKLGSKLQNGNRVFVLTHPNLWIRETGSVLGYSQSYVLASWEYRVNGLISPTPVVHLSFQVIL